MIKCEKTSETIEAAEIKRTVKDMLVEFAAVSQSIAEVMLKNGISEENVMIMLAHRVERGIKEAKEAIE